MALQILFCRNSGLYGLAWMMWQAESVINPLVPRFRTATFPHVNRIAIFAFHHHRNSAVIAYLFTKTLPAIVDTGLF